MKLMMLDLLTNTELNLGLLLASDLDMLLLFIHVTGMKVISLNLGGICVSINNLFRK